MRRTAGIAVFGLVLGLFTAPKLSAELSWKTTSLDFRPPPGTQSIRAEFPFSNNGSIPIKIKNVTPSCGCLSTKLSTETVAPGEGGVLTVLFKTGGQGGRSTKSVRVTTDEAGASPVTLRLDVEIARAYTLKPRLLTWKANANLESKAAEIRFAEGSELSPPKITEVPPGFKATLNPEEHTPGAYAIVITPESGAPLKRVPLILQIEGPKQPRFTLQLLLEIEKS